MMNKITPQQTLDVFYDGHCPVCRMEVGWYGRMDKTGQIAWIDITTLADSELPHGKTRDILLNRFHARDRAGAWHVGVDAFARIWRELPVLKHLAFLFALPVLRQITEAGYRAFLAWQRRDRRRRERERLT